ncbi:hypothetical protein [Alkalibacillus silvisoli]|uniref:Secreted protein n=1 Tax=Alkalibacillus silvisoli TaxID=392823 RepID=A0ABN0ZYV3_9BACI
MQRIGRMYVISALFLLNDCQADEEMVNDKVIDDPSGYDKIQAVIDEALAAAEP